MTYKEASEFFLAVFNLPEQFSEWSRKLQGYENLRKSISSELGDLLGDIQSAYMRLNSFDYVYRPYGSCSTIHEIIISILNDAYSDEEHTHYKNIKEYLNDDALTSAEREVKWSESRHFMMEKYPVQKVVHHFIRINNQQPDDIIRGYDSNWEYSQKGSYSVYKQYKDTPEFSILMAVIERHNNLNAAKNEFELVILQKELDAQIEKVGKLLQLTGNKPINVNKSYKLYYELVELIHDFCDKNYLQVDLDILETSLKSADFKSIIDLSNRKNCWKSMLMHLSKTIKGGSKEQNEWYDAVTKSIGITKSESRKGTNNLPVGFDEELNGIVGKFYKKRVNQV